jgi:hypothetical protein
VRGRGERDVINERDIEWVVHLMQNDGEKMRFSMAGWSGKGYVTLELNVKFVIIIIYI